MGEGVPAGPGCIWVAFSPMKSHLSIKKKKEKENQNPERVHGHAINLCEAQAS